MDGVGFVGVGATFDGTLNRFCVCVCCIDLRVKVHIFLLLSFVLC